MSNTPLSVPELAKPILIHQIKHFSNLIIYQDVDRNKSWEALEVRQRCCDFRFGTGSDTVDSVVFCTAPESCQKTNS